MAMDLTGLGSYTDYMTDANRVNTENLQKQLENTAQAKETENDALLDACKQFEAYLWEQIYKEMEKTTKVFSDDEDGDAYASNMVDYSSRSLHRRQPSNRIRWRICCMNRRSATIILHNVNFNENGLLI